MRRRHWLGVGVVLVAAIAGDSVLLTGLDFGGHANVQYLDVSQADADDSIDRTVAFAALDPDQQRVFERALGDVDGYVEIPAGVNESVWIENDGVRYRGQRYVVAVAVS